MVPSVEEVSSSLVREYLSRKGLKRTIACMDEEHPRTEASINNRSELRQILSIEDLYRKNKLQNSPLKTLLEVIVKHLIEQVKNEKIVSSEGVSLRRAQTSPMDNAPAGEEDGAPASFPSKQTRSRLDITATFPSQATNASLMPANDRKSSNDQTGFRGPDLGVQKDHLVMDSPQDNKSLIQKEPEKNTSETTQRSRTNRIRRGILAGPVPQESNRKRNSRKVSQPLLRREEGNRPSQDGRLVTGSHPGSLQSSRSEISSADCVREGREALSVSQRTPSENSFERVGLNMVTTTKAKTRPSVADLDASAMVLDDIEDYDDDLRELCDAPLRRTLPEHSLAGRPMDQRTATELKTLLLGSSLNCFNIEWRNQGFTFLDTHDLRYGIVQRKGGPCGVLASVQAFVLKKLLFESTESCNVGLQRLRPSNSIRRKCLVLALAEILWRAGEETQATVAINSGRNQFIPARPYRSEGVLEKITCLTVENLKDLELILEQHVDQFETGMLGCMLLTVSAVLSRSIQKVQEDMDVPTTTLIGAHGYCTQELVNLLLCGRAVSNVFDNDMELDSGNGNMTLLKGIKGHCDVGLLSLFEHYNICKVGAYLKTPRYPIWVVCSESHFSVLFGLQRELLTNEGTEFDLYYFDGLANQQEEIRLTVSVGRLTQSSQDVDTDLIPPMELCIRTRWKDAFVSWNDTEPIL
ncbi:probable ubiquitin carboxyl-terminal hydrolase MINDY-4 isoform X1 [Oreochromis niloticus]|uniref:Ubiquitin carboxyl-terminal hydrolase MINDY n=2 Tax=Oreochromis TaxID=8139 RepID=I3IZY2_ORENI|nr:probable ubiquitin carboxyl-terminal hydrolase MINDY-4 isoform X1 [Oreochromis niloticus]XP_031601383.1 probable ubiquitin carboxyl-terminal hydrolase MINDY-4 isoform X1 [Oreochromis aureus]